MELLRGFHASLGGARNPHVQKYVSVAVLRPPSLKAARNAPSTTNPTYPNSILLKESP
jgi:hypothetical protein